MAGDRPQGSSRAQEPHRNSGRLRESGVRSPGPGNMGSDHEQQETYGTNHYDNPDLGQGPSGRGPSTAETDGNERPAAGGPISPGGHSGAAPGNDRPSDGRIHDEICDRMIQDQELDPGDVEVTVRDGEVTLQGTVDTRVSKKRAEDIAGDVAGVTDVHNRLRIRLGRGAGQELPLEED